MSSAPLWVILLFSIVITVYAGHFIIVKILPRIKLILENILNEKTAGAIMYIFLVYIAIFILKKIVELLTAVENPYLALLKIFIPGLELLNNLAPYFAWLILAIVVVSGLNCCKKK